jgi:hypothetical protein
MYARLIVLVVCAFCSSSSCLAAQTPNTLPTNAAPTNLESERYTPEGAFQKAIRPLLGRIDFSSESGTAIIRWTKEGSWLIELKGYPELQHDRLYLSVKADSVASRLGTNVIQLEEWLTSHERKATARLKFSAGVALRKALATWRRHDSVAGLMDTGGRITLCRANHSWFVDLFGYSSMPLAPIFHKPVTGFSK